MIVFKVNGHESSYVPENHRWNLVWADEFDGSVLDRTKWDYRLHMMGTRHMAWEEDGVILDGNSNAVFRIFEKDGRIVSSQLQTGYNYMDAPLPAQKYGSGLYWNIGKLRENLHTWKYGYFECRCRLQQMPGWWSAFWMQSPVIGCSPDPGEAGVENDIMECFRPGEVIYHCNHCGGYGADHKEYRIGKGRRNLDRSIFHTFGMYWDENGYIFYIDGEEDGRSAFPVSHRQQFVLISTEVNGYRSVGKASDEAKTAAQQGDTFLVDYVRVFQKTDN